jgi:hypothetical protein
MAPASRWLLENKRDVDLRGAILTGGVFLEETNLTSLRMEDVVFKAS